MPNVLGAYDPIFYAQEALILLEKNLGMAARIHRGFDRTPQDRGSVITIRKPSTFVVQDAPGTDQDLNTEQVSITLNQWKEVKFALSDKELTYTGEQIVNEHIRPAAYALADYIDQSLVALYKDIPWFTGTAGATPNSVSNITKARQRLFDNKVPFNDPTALHMVIDGAAESEFLALTAFSQYQGAGDDGARTQFSGSLGRKFGFELSANQNIPTHTKGTADDTALKLNGAHLKGATVVSLLAVDAGVAGTLVPGDTFVIAGNTQRYAITNTNTAVANAFAAVSITPALAADGADTTAVTVTLQNGVRNLAFHRDAFALAVAPLSDLGDGVGARIATAQDPITGLTLRARLWYSGDTSKVKVALDILYGIKTLNPNLASIMLG
jgi:hypothetical protein